MKLKISKYNENGTLVGLLPILDCVTPYVTNSKWIIEEIKGYGMLTSGISIEEFRNLIRNSVPIRLERIVDELAGLGQITDLELTCLDGRIKSIVCFDASFWEIDCDASVVNTLLEKSREQGFTATIA